MKKYIILVSLIFGATQQLSVAMDNDDLESADSNYEQAETDQNDEYQENEIENSQTEKYDNNEDENPRNDEISKKAYVKSIVDNILKLKSNEANGLSSDGRRIKADKRVCQLLDHIQDDLKKLNGYLSKRNSKDNNERKEINSNHSKKKNITRKTSGSYTKRRRSYSHSRYNPSEKENTGECYTVKNFTRQRKYIPKNFSLYYGNHSYYDGYKSNSWRTSAFDEKSYEQRYMVKNWGTGESTLMEDIPRRLTTKKYFKKSSCNENKCR